MIFNCSIFDGNHCSNLDGSGHIKAIKGATVEEKQRNKAADELYSAAVSSVREPVEAFYSWLINKTNIQRAQKCRSTAGLLMHTLGKLAIAFIFLIFNY